MLNELSFWQLLGVVGVFFAGLIGTIFIVKVSVSINLVEFLEHRREIKRRRLQNLCPHATVVEIPNSDDFGIRSYFETPPGTYNYICGRCKLVVLSREQAIRLREIWDNNPIGLIEREKRFNKEISKFFKLKL